MASRLLLSEGQQRLTNAPALQLGANRNVLDEEAIALVDQHNDAVHAFLARDEHTSRLDQCSVIVVHRQRAEPQRSCPWLIG